MVLICSHRQRDPATMFRSQMACPTLAIRRRRFADRVMLVGCAGLLAVSMASASWGCGANAFACGDDSQCAGSGVGGLCEASGFCSFPDEGCDSGRRYGDHAEGAFAGACVDLGETSSSSGPSSATATATATITTTVTTTLDSTAVTLTSEATTAPSTEPTMTVTAESQDTSATDGSSTTGSTSDCGVEWWDCDFSRRLRLSLGPDVPGVAAAMPLLVSLTPGRWDSSTAQPQGQDLRFVDADGALVPHEIESVGPTTLVWIRWPGVDATAVTVYWGNPDAPDGQAPASVWQDGHEAVWHMADGTDSLGFHLLGSYGAEVVDGRFAQASRFDGTSYMQGEPGDTMAALFAGPATIEAWVYLDSFGSQGRGRVVDNANDPVPTVGWSLQVRDSSPVNAIQLELGHDQTEQGWSAADVVDVGQWYYLAVVHLDGEVTLYVDGAAQESTTWPGVGEIALDTDTPVTIGRVSGTNAGWFDGVIDEVRLSSAARDGDWIATQWASADDAVLAYGTAEAQPR